MGLEFTGENAGSVQTVQLDDVDYWHVWKIEDYPREGVLDVWLRGYKTYTERSTNGLTAMRLEKGPIRIEGDDYSEDMTLAEIYAHVQTLDDGDGVDWTVSSDKDPDA